MKLNLLYCFFLELVFNLVFSNKKRCKNSPLSISKGLAFMSVSMAIIKNSSGFFVVCIAKLVYDFYLDYSSKIKIKMKKNFYMNVY